MKVLNLYAGIGGNRKLWEGIDVTAVELDPKIAGIYQDFFPDDKVVIEDAHKYLLDHFEEYDFIWSSPPCPTHSRIRRIHCLADKELQGEVKPLYPDMQLYQEILLLQGYFKGKYCIENVESWYEPLIKPQKVQRHFFWANFHIPDLDLCSGQITGGGGGKVEVWEKKYGFDMSGYDEKNEDKGLMLRNCVHPKLGKHIFDSAFRVKTLTLKNWDNIRKEGSV